MDIQTSTFIDAAFVGTDDKYYVLTEDRCARYTPDVGVDEGYPRQISQEWPRVWNTFPGPYDAATDYKGKWLRLT